MSVRDFDCFVQSNRSFFRALLENNLIWITNKDVEENFKDWIIQECFGRCYSEFEEQTMMENLKEEFELFMKEAKGA